MTQCPRCGKPVSTWDRDLATGLCPQCRTDDAAKDAARNRAWDEARRRQIEAVNAKLAVQPRRGPISAWMVIAAGILLAVVGGLILAGAVANRSIGAVVFAKIILVVAWFVVLAGVVRWAVSGSNLFQLNRVHRQNLEMLDLLEIVADQGGHSKALDILRDQMEGGQLSHEEYRKRRRELLRDESGGASGAT